MPTRCLVLVPVRRQRGAAGGSGLAAKTTQPERSLDRTSGLTRISRLTICATTSMSSWASFRICGSGLPEQFKLAEAMGMNGTPSYVIGKQIVIGAFGAETLREKISNARCGKATC